MLISCRYVPSLPSHSICSYHAVMFHPCLRIPYAHIMPLCSILAFAFHMLISCRYVPSLPSHSICSYHAVMFHPCLRIPYAHIMPLCSIKARLSCPCRQSGFFLFINVIGKLCSRGPLSMPQEIAPLCWRMPQAINSMLS